MISPIRRACAGGFWFVSRIVLPSNRFGAKPAASAVNHVVRCLFLD